MPMASKPNRTQSILVYALIQLRSWIELEAMLMVKEPYPPDFQRLAEDLKERRTFIHGTPPWGERKNEQVFTWLSEWIALQA